MVKPQANYINEHWKRAYTRRGWPWQLLIPMVLGGIATFPLILRFGVGHRKVLYDILNSVGIALPGAIFTVLFSVIGFAIGKRFNKNKNGVIIFATIFMIFAVAITFTISLLFSFMPI